MTDKMLLYSYILQYNHGKKAYNFWNVNTYFAHYIVKIHKKKKIY